MANLVMGDSSHDRPLIRSGWRGWGLVPGPIDFVEPFDSTKLQEPVAEYDVSVVAQTTLRIPGVQLMQAAKTSWWDWSAGWSGATGSYLTLEMTLLDDPPVFGGFHVDGHCTPSELLDLWLALRRNFPRLWLHSPECRLYKPEGFRAEYLRPADAARK